jgi:NADH:ubiquinone oxidoreductase subunit E
LFDQLRAIQQEFGYLPADQLRQLAAKINVPVSRIHTVASFYPHFHLTPPPRTEVKICSDMSCHLRGGTDLKATLQQACRGQKAEDLSIRDVSCLGRCDKAPAFSVNDRIYCGLEASAAVALVSDSLSGRKLPPEPRDRPQRAVVSDPYNGHSDYSVIRRFVETRNWEGIVAALKASGLRGMGGAGFPTGNKWEIVRNAPGKAKYIVCNADESEPGTIKDRFIMETVPHLVIEGMIIAGLVTGARQGILYIRHEYEEPREVLQEEIDRCYREGLLGKRILSSDLAFDLEVFVSPGGYICGEESALLEAIEGKRAEPRNKPPFPGTNGLWNQPTVINNVETFTFATVILARGPEWFKTQGKNGSACRRCFRESKPSGFRALGPIIRLFAGVDGRSATGLERNSRRWLDGRFRRDRRLRRGALHARYGAECSAFLSQRIVRQMRPLPDGFTEDGGNADGLDRRPVLRRRPSTS